MALRHSRLAKKNFGLPIQCIILWDLKVQWIIQIFAGFFFFTGFWILLIILFGSWTSAFVILTIGLFVRSFNLQIVTCCSCKHL